MLNKLHFEILSKEQLEIINRISEINKNFLLVGGTAISLQIGHRQSIDFDFFSDKEFDMDSLKNDLRKYISFDKVLIDKINEFTFISNNVKLTYLYYPFKITENIIQTEYNINIPDINPLEIKGIKITRLSNSQWIDKFDKRFDPYGNEYYWFTGEYIVNDDDPECDDNAVNNGFISVSPLSIDFTDYNSLSDLKRFEKL